jgi:hypothetical protein
MRGLHQMRTTKNNPMDEAVNRGAPEGAENREYRSRSRNDSILPRKRYLRH